MQCRTGANGARSVGNLDVTTKMSRARRLVAPRAAVLLAVAMALAGCGVVSVHPLYTANDLVAEPGIVGCWAEPDAKEITLKFFQRPAGNAYTMICDDGVPATFSAHLVRLGGSLYMDTILESGENEPESGRLGNLLFASHLVTGHMLWRIQVRGNVLRLAWLDEDRLREALDQGAVSVAHERQKGEEGEDLTIVPPTIILTASTAELQDFVLKAGDKLFTEDMGELHRKHPSPPKAKPSLRRSHRPRQ